VILSLVVFTLLCPALFGQVTIGAKKGFSLASLYGFDNPEDTKRKALTGFNGGVFADIALSHRFSLQPEILFNRRGVKEEGGGYEYSWIASYFDIPVLAKMNFAFLDDLLQASVYLGPQFSFGVSSTMDSESEGPDDEGEGEVQPFDLGLAVGAEAGVRLLPFDLFVDLRYVLGFLSVVDPDDAYGQRPKNMTFSVLFGFGYTL